MNPSAFRITYRHCKVAEVSAEDNSEGIANHHLGVHNGEIHFSQFSVGSRVALAPAYLHS